MLLRALEYGEIQKVGEDKGSRRVDVRIIGASNRDLREMVENSSFREDLFYRFNVFGIRVPALRERISDVPMLAAHFLRGFRTDSGSGPSGFEAAAIAVLQSYDWPGNVRELRNAVRRAAVLCEGPNIRCEDLPPRVLMAAGEHVKPSASSLPRQRIEVVDSTATPCWRLDDLVAAHIRRALDVVGGNKTKAAELLEIPRTSLYHKLRKYGIETLDSPESSRPRT